MTVHPLVSPWGRFGLYSFFIDAPEPAIVDTGIASSPAEGMAPGAGGARPPHRGRALDPADPRPHRPRRRRPRPVGAHRPARPGRDPRGRRADAALAPGPRGRVPRRAGAVPARPRGRGEADGRTAEAVISGEMEPTVLVTGGETLSLGGDVTVSVHSHPGPHRRVGRLRRRRPERRLRRRRGAGPRGRQRLPRLRGPRRLPREPGVPARRDPSPAPVPRAPVPPRRRRALRRRARRASRRRRRCRRASTSRRRIGAAARRCLARRPAGDRLGVLPVRPRRRGARLHGRPHARAVAVLHDDARLRPQVRRDDVSTGAHR